MRWLGGSKSNSITKEIGFYFVKGIRLFEKHKIFFFLSTALALMVQGAELVETYLLANIIDALYGQNTATFTLNVIVACILGVCSIVFGLVVGKIDFGIQVSVIIRLKRRVMSILYDRKEEVVNFSTGEQYSMIDEDPDALVSYVYRVMSYLYSILVILVIGSILFTISLKWTLLYGVVLVLEAIIQRRGAITLKEKSIECLEVRNEFQKCLNEEVGFLQAIRFENLKGKVVDFAYRKLGLVNDKLVEQNDYALKLSMLSQFVAFSGKMMLFIGMGLEVLRGMTTMKEFVVFYSYMTSFSESFLSVIRMISSLQPSLVNVRRICGILELESQEEIKKEPSYDSISLQRVYKDFEGNRIFEDANLEMNMEYTYGLIGPNGSGKSTFMRMILGQESVTHGSLSIDGKEIQKYGMNTLGGICYYAAIPCVMSGLSVMENMLLGECNEEYSEETLHKICKDFLFYQDVQDMKKGLHSVVGEDVNLSSGQMKKIQLIRAALSHAQIIALDEPFANLDEEFKTNFNVVFQKYFSGKKFIVIEHDEGRISFVDRVIHIEKGKLV